MAIEPSFLPDFTQSTQSAIHTSIPTARRGAEQVATATKGFFRRNLEKSLVGKALGYGSSKRSYVAAGMEIPGAGPSLGGQMAEAGADSGGSGILKSSGESFGSLFAYATSSWAIMCVFMTIVLNRTMLYASLRRPLRPPFRLRLVLRGIPILLLAFHLQSIVYSLRCETSPNITTSQMGSPQFSKTWRRGEQGGYLYWVARVGTFWEPSDAKICVASGMAPADLMLGTKTKDMDASDLGGFSGSLDILWPLYTTIAMSHFVETLSCALQGTVPAPETGMTFFEHSMAFAQAESMAFNNPFAKSNVKPHPKNVPPEVLYIALISACGHLTSQLAGLYGRQSRYRLYTTGFWGIATLAGFAWACYGPWADGDVAMLRLRRFPTVCVVGFIPHLVICMGIIICTGIYSLALVFTSLQPPPQPSSEPGAPPVRPRPSLSAGFQNLQATITIQSHAFPASEDFYTALLRLGLLVLTAASEATYLNEGQPIRVPGLTWLETERLKFLEREKKDKGERAIFEGSFGDRGSTNGEWSSPYDVERKEFSKEMAGLKGRRRNSNSRWRSATEIIRGTTLIAVRWAVWGFLRVFKPDAIGPELQESNGTEIVRVRDITPTVDSASEDEETDDEKLYRNFLLGKAVAHEQTDDDESDSEFVPQSLSRESSVDPYDSDSSVSSQTEHYPSSSRASTPTPESYRQTQALTRANPSDPFPTISDPTSFANLLDPKTPEQRQMAKLLAHHLRSDQVVTRSAHRNELRRRQRTLLLGAGERVSKDEEEDVLESIILEARSKSQHLNGGRSALGVTYQEDEGGTLQGPMCVVCQSSPRTIMVWPCRCLSLCEECRVNLAVNNYATCVCCRGELCGFSRVYVP